MKRGPDLVEILVIAAVVVAFGYLYFSRNSSGGVVVVNFDEVVRGLDLDLKFQSELGRFEANLQSQLQTESTALQAKHEALQKEYGDSPTQEQADELSEFKSQLDTQRRQAMGQIRSQLDVHKQRLVQAFRDEIAPVAHQVAAKRGANIVLSKIDILSVDPSADITEEVLRQMRSSQRGPTDSGKLDRSMESPPMGQPDPPSSDSDSSTAPTMQPSQTPNSDG